MTPELNARDRRPPAPLPPGAPGFTLVELLVVVAVVGVIASIAVPSLLRARISANETTAVASLRAISSAQAAYSASAGGGYATDLTTLGVPCAGGGQGFISADLAVDPALKSGYRLEVQPATGAMAGPSDCNGTPSRAGFYSTAVPTAPGVSGHKGFASNASAAIFFDISGIAPTETAIAPGGGAEVLK